MWWSSSGSNLIHFITTRQQETAEHMNAIHLLILYQILVKVPSLDKGFIMFCKERESEREREREREREKICCAHK